MENNRLMVDEHVDLRDRDNRKVHGMIVVDAQGRLKYLCASCDGEFIVIDTFARHIEAHHLKEVKPTIIESIELDSDSDNESNANNQHLVENNSENIPQAEEHNNFEMIQEDVNAETPYQASMPELNGANPNASTSNEASNEQNEVTTPEKSGQLQPAQNASTEAKKPVYKCAYCLSEFLSKSGHLYHLRVHHATQFLFHCDLCPVSSNNRNELQRHIRNHTIRFQYKCSFCSEILHTNFQKVNHEKQRHSGAECTCKPCGKLFKTVRILRAHNAKFHSKK